MGVNILLTINYRANATHECSRIYPCTTVNSYPLTNISQFPHSLVPSAQRLKFKCSESTCSAHLCVWLVSLPSNNSLDSNLNRIFHCHGRASNVVLRNPILLELDFEIVFALPFSIYKQRRINTWILCITHIGVRENASLASYFIIYASLSLL